MNTLRVKIELIELDGQEIDGYSFGDFTILGRFGSLSSRGHYPNQSMMIFLSIPELLYGIKNLIENNINEYEFVGIGSSFRFFLEKKKNSILIRKDNGFLLEKVPRSDFIRAIWNEIVRFKSESVSQLKDSDLSYIDILESINEFQKLLEEK